MKHEAMIPCRVRWCTALAGVERTHCVVHGLVPSMGPGWQRPLELAPGERFTYVRVIGEKAYDDFDDCTTCLGDGKCTHCDGEGIHTCGCGDEHDCHECDGTGDCQDCDGASGRHDITNENDARSRASLLSPSWANAVTDDERRQGERYLRAIYLPAWEPR